MIARRLALAVLIVASWGSMTDASAADKRYLSGLTMVPPDGAEVTSKVLDDGVEVIAVTRGDEVCLITIYAKRLPPSRALEVTLEELSRQVRKTAVPESVTVKRFKMRMFRRWRSARRVDYAMNIRGDRRRMQAHVVAGSSKGRTVVVSWNAPRAGIALAFSPELIRTLGPAKATKKRRPAPKKRGK